ncbi:MAG: LEA type 2 family protein [Treponema sp.]|jgi:LEA14-like dessication related protein|nr:LEA type 2 family protein [Treponema sp.]
MKKPIFFAILSLCALLGLATCQTLMSAVDEPVVSFHSAEVTGITFNGVQLLCKVQIENPNAFDIPFPEIGWQLFLNSNSLINGTIKNNQRLKAKNATIVEVPVRVDYLEVFNAAASLKGQNTANYKAALAVKFPIPVIRDKVWNLEYEGNLPLPQMPRLSAPSLRFEKADLSSTTIVFTVNVQNPNPFELPAPKINFDFQVNRTSVVNSSTSSDSALTPNSTTPVSMRFTVRQADIVRVLASNLLTASSIACNLNTSFDFGIPAFGSDAVNLQVPGTLPLR